MQEWMALRSLQEVPRPLEMPPPLFTSSTGTHLAAVVDILVVEEALKALVDTSPELLTGAPEAKREQESLWFLQDFASVAVRGDAAATVGVLKSDAARSVDDLMLKLMSQSISNFRKERCQSETEIGERKFVLLSQAHEALGRKDYVFASKVYDMVLNLEPDATLYSNDKFCKLQMGDGEGALSEAYSCRMMMRPYWAKACYRQAAAHILLKEYKQARDALVDAQKFYLRNLEIERELRKALEVEMAISSSNQDLHFLSPALGVKSVLERCNNYNTGSGNFSELNPHDALDHCVRDTVTWSFNGNKYQVLLSFIYAILYFRFWNFSRGTWVDISSVVGYQKIICFVTPEGCFRFHVTYDNDYIDFVFDGCESWFYAWETADGAYEFKPPKGRTGYIKHRKCKLLEFPGNYDYIAPDKKPGRIEMSLLSLIDAFREVRSSDGKTTLALRLSLGRWVLFLGECSKFHIIFLYCCKSILYKDILTLDAIDKSLGLMLKKWGKFCEIAVKYLLDSASGDKTSLQATLEEIEMKQVPEISCLQDVLDNVCLYTSGSILKYIKTKQKSDPAWWPIDWCMNPAAIVSLYQKKLYGNDHDQVKKVQEETMKKVDCFAGSAGGLPHRTLVTFVEKHRPKLFCASTWRSNIPVKHYGPMLSKNLSMKRTLSTSVYKSNPQRIIDTLQCSKSFCYAAFKVLQCWKK